MIIYRAIVVDQRADTVRDFGLVAGSSHEALSVAERSCHPYEHVLVVEVVHDKPAPTTVGERILEAVIMLAIALVIVLVIWGGIWLVAALSHAIGRG